MKKQMLELIEQERSNSKLIIDKIEILTTDSPLEKAIERATLEAVRWTMNSVLNNLKKRVADA